MNNSVFNLNRRRLMSAIGASALAAPLSSCGNNTSPNRRSAVVIGAGIGGLSAAYELIKGGFDVSVYEKWNYIGGRMREAWRGQIYGPTHALGVFEANKEMFDLAEEIGISEEMEGVALSDALVTENEFGQYNTALRFRIDEVQRISGLSSEARALLPKLQADLNEIAASVDPCSLATGASWDGESLAEYYLRILGKEAGQEVIRYWIDAVLMAFGFSAQEVSKIVILSLFAQQDSEFVVPRGGIGVLTRKLAGLLPVQTSTTVRFISPPNSAGKRTVHYLTPEFERQSVTPDVIVLATEGKYIASLVQGLSPREHQFFSDIEFTKAAGATFVLNEAGAPLSAQGGGYIPTHPDAIKRKVGSWYVSPPNKVENSPATASIYLNRPEFKHWQQSGKTQQDYCFEILQQIYPVLEHEHISDAVVSGCDDLVSMPVGYVKEIAFMLTQQEQTRRSLYYAGEYFSGCHTGAACASGRSVARTILRHWA